MQKTSICALTFTILASCNSAAEPLPDAIWSVKSADSNGIAKAVNFNGGAKDGTETALLLECMNTSPNIRVQHGLIDDDDLTWDTRGTAEYTAITYTIDGGEEATARAFLIGLDGSKFSLAIDNEAELMTDFIAATRVSFNIAAATFDRPGTAVNVTFNMTDAAAEIGDVLNRCREK
jgi:hypothetical protein